MDVLDPAASAISEARQVIEVKPADLAPTINVTPAKPAVVIQHESPLAGAQSLFIADIASGSRYVSFDFADVRSFYVAFRFKVSPIVSVNSGFLYIYIPSGSGLLARLTGTGTNETMQTWVAPESNGAWSATQVQTDGVSTGSAGHITLDLWEPANPNFTFDNWLFKATDIAWSELS
jgi:hypothetical protein